MGDFLTKVTDVELSKLDGLTAGTATASKALILGANKNVDVIAVADLKLGAGAGTSVTATAAELNTLASSGVSNADLVKLHGITKSYAEINGVANSATANPQQLVEAALTATTSIDGSDQVGKTAVLGAIQALETKVNNLITKLKAAAIIASS